MSESNIRQKDTAPYSTWEGAYPFTLMASARNVYQGRAIAGAGQWSGDSGVGYLTMNGLLQELTWSVKGQHRPVRLMIKHTDENGVPNNANYNVGYEYHDRGLDAWVDVITSVVGFDTYNPKLGETFERQGGQYRLLIQGTEDHRLHISPYIQLLQGSEGGSRQGGGWPK